MYRTVTNAGAEGEVAERRWPGIGVLDRARHGLAHAAFTLVEMHLREVSAGGSGA